VQVQTDNLEFAVAEFQRIVELDNTFIDGFVQLGHCHFKLGNNTEAIKAYLRAIRVANLTQTEIKDQLVYQRAGHIYIKEEKWEDARVMFLMCAESYRTAFSYFNLGVASYNLGEFNEAERVLSLVNYMDPLHAKTWAYLCLVQLKRPDPPVNSAYQTMNEAFKLGLTDIWILQEIGLAWADANSFKASREAFERAITIAAGSKNKKRALDYLKTISSLIDDGKEMNAAEGADAQLREEVSVATQ
jgi:tetratricopeptide (TPR) repeat protein